MYKVEKSALVMQPAEKMFHLVDAVEDYPKFLPWCGGTEVHLRDDVMTKATIHINYHGLKQHFTTQNTKTFPTHMQIVFVDGPFKTLEGEWQFFKLQENACKITFRLQYAFNHALLEKAIAPIFGHIANTFVDHFIKRAEQTRLP